MIVSCTSSDNDNAANLVREVTDSMAPLSKEAAQNYWMGTTTGENQYFTEYSSLNVKISDIFSDPVKFNKIKELVEHGKISDPLLKREMDILYNLFLANQADTLLLRKIIEKSSLLEQKFASFRAEFRGEKITDNQVEEILRNSTDNEILKEAWLSHKEIGNLVSGDIIELAKLRNQLATSLGFDNYHTMSLKLSGQDPAEVSALMDELDGLTSNAFASLKEEMDASFAKRYKTEVSNLMPWHYQGRFFQESPQLYQVDLDKYYKGKNLEKLTEQYYESIGIDVSSIMENSDLYSRPGKNQHAYCIDIDRNGDIRVLANISDTEQWMGTMLHEFGHAVYAIGHDSPKNPYLIREAAHPFTTEAIAMLFGRLSRNPQWIKEMTGISEQEMESIAEDCRKSLTLQQLVFSRWVQVMYRFEKEMYSNPDQDLNNVWWNLVQKYQMLSKPEGRDMPDWSTKVHVALYPCYYHNYQLGELLASQLQYHISNKIMDSDNPMEETFTGQKEVGMWLMDNIFTQGMRYEWNEMIEKATGEKLTAKYYAMQFVGNL